MARAICEPVRRTAPDECPGSIELRPAEDGLLARLRLPGGRLTAERIRGLARAAELGNGLVDLTSRGNVQVRGLSDGCGPELEAVLASHTLLPSVAHDRARNIVASPVGGRHPSSLIDTDAVVASLDRGMCGDAALAELPGKFLFCVDDGSGLGLRGDADISLIAVAGENGSGFECRLAGQTVSVGLAPEEAVRAALGAARAFLAERRSTGEQAWRIRELAGGVEAVARRADRAALPANRRAGADRRTRAESRAGTESTHAQDRRQGLAGVAPRALEPGSLAQRDGRLAITALVPLGRLDTRALELLGALGRELRISGARTVTAIDVAVADGARVEAALAAAGLVLDPRSGWLGLSACAGLGRCPRALVDVRAAAARRAQVRDGNATRTEHWAACQRRCGRRGDEAIAVAAARGGELELACADAAPRRLSNIEQTLAALA